MRLPRPLPLGHVVFKTEQAEPPDNAILEETINRVAAKRDKKRKRETTTLDALLSPVKKEPRLWLHGKDDVYKKSNDGIIALIGDDPHRFWPRMARRVWYYCHEHCPTLVDSFGHWRDTCSTRERV